MSVWITTLGQVRVRVNGRERKALSKQHLRCALLVYLAVERDVTRESLISIFWQERKKPRPILNQHVYELRRAIGETAIITTADRVQVADFVAVDVHLFESQAAAGDHAAAIETYAGGFLQGFPLIPSDALDAWVDRRQGHLTRLHRRVRREHIQALLNDGQGRAALEAALAWADRDRLEDEAQHACIELLLRAGRTAEARIRFEQYQDDLRRELEVAPLEQTAALFDAQHQPLPGAGDASAIDASEQSAEVRRRSGVATARGTVAWRPASILDDGWTWLRVNRGRVVAAMLFGVIVTLGAVLLLKAPPPAPQSLALHRDETGYDPSRVIVLPFRDDSQFKDLGHIANGLTDWLTVELKKVDALSVVSRSGLRYVSDQEVSIQEIADSLKVGSIVAATIQRSGDSLRVAVQLLDASAQVIDVVVLTEAVGELFQLLDQLVYEVSRFLRDRIGREIEFERRRRETTVNAWLRVQQAVDEAEEIWRRETMFSQAEAHSSEAALIRADILLQQAEREDPKWTEPTLLRGWVALGRAKVIGQGRLDEYDAWIEKALQYANHVLADDSVHARALELRGTLLFHRARANRKSERSPGILAAAERDLAQAVGMDNKLAGAWNTLSRLQQYSGRAAEAMFAVQQALNADDYLSKDADIKQRLWRLELDSREFEKAWKECRQAHIDHPAEWRFVDCHLSIAATAPDRFPLDSAARLVQRARRMDGRGSGAEYRDTYRRVQLAVIVARERGVRHAQDSLEQIRATVRRNAAQNVAFGFDEAHLLLQTGDTAGALDALERYLVENPGYRAYVAGSFVFASLRDHARFRALTDGA